MCRIGLGGRMIQNETPLPGHGELPSWLPPLAERRVMLGDQRLRIENWPTLKLQLAVAEAIRLHRVSYKKTLSAWLQASNAADRLLAAAYGWCLSRKDYASEDLALIPRKRRRFMYGEAYPGAFDHVTCFRERVRPFRPAAILSHTYWPITDCEAVAASLGLELRVLPVSWYYPGVARAVLYLRKHKE